MEFSKVVQARQISTICKKESFQISEQWLLTDRT
jgi:hypothetical protein